MNTTQFKNGYYLQRNYQRVSETEFKCRLVVKSRTINQEITEIETKLNTLDIGQGIADSQFSITPISRERYLNQTITMLFNLLMFRLNINDLYNVAGEEKIAEFFDSNPFHEE